MLIILPPSESKREAPKAGEPVDLGGLSFPELTETRERILDALIRTSAGADAFRQLMVPPSLASQVARNTVIRELPTRPTLDVYIGPLHQGLAWATLSRDGAARAASTVVVTSPLWGALRPADRIPPYRLRSWASVVDVGRPDHAWRPLLPGVLATAAGSAGVVLDLRSREVQHMGTPSDLPERVVELRVRQWGNGRRIGDVVAKRVRGEAARHLLETGTEPSDPDALADALGDRWPVSLEPPSGPTRPWTLTLTVDE